MKKSDLVKYCEKMLQNNNDLFEENSKYRDAEKQYKVTIDNLEKVVAELREKCANTPVFLCSFYFIYLYDPNPEDFTLLTAHLCTYKLYTK